MTTEEEARAKEDLKAELLDISIPAAKFHYFPIRFLQMVSDYGPVTTAEKLLADTEIQSGLIRLWDNGAPGINLEATILKPEYAGLFQPEVLKAARERLAKLGSRPAYAL